MPLITFNPKLYTGEEGLAIPTGQIFHPQNDIGLLSDGDSDTGIQLQSDENVFSFDHWDTNNAYVNLSSFIFEIDLMQPAKGTLTVVINYPDLSVQQQETTANSGVYQFNPTLINSNTLLLPPSSIQNFNQITLAVRHSSATLPISEIRMKILTNIGGYIKLGSGHDDVPLSGRVIIREGKVII